jgi:polar amino acid transport system substrate-binding protein
MSRLLLTIVMGFFLMSAASAQTPSPEALKDLAPTGKLRVAINLGNSVLAQKDEKTGELKGISVDLAKEVSKRASLPIELIPFPAAGKVFEALKDRTWDMAFLAIEPVRAAEIEFTEPYVIIEGKYMVPKDSALKTIADVDQKGVRIAVGPGSAYDLYLTRTLKNATLVRAEMGGGEALLKLFEREKLEAVGGVKQPLEAYAATHPEVRMIDGAFMDIRQAMGVPKGRVAAAKYLSSFIEEMKKSGFVAEGLKRSGQVATVAPPAK